MAYNHLVTVMDGDIKTGTFTERAILIEACYRADRRGILRYSQAELAREMKLSPRTVTYHINGLISKSLLEKIANGRYKITLPKL